MEDGGLCPGSPGPMRKPSAGAYLPALSTRPGLTKEWKKKRPRWFNPGWERASTGPGRLHVIATHTSKRPVTLVVSGPSTWPFGREKKDEGQHTIQARRIVVSVVICYRSMKTRPFFSCLCELGGELGGGRDATFQQGHDSFREWVGEDIPLPRTTIIRRGIVPRKQDGPSLAMSPMASAALAAPRATGESPLEETARSVDLPVCFKCMQQRPWWHPAPPTQQLRYHPRSWDEPRRMSRQTAAITQAKRLTADLVERLRLMPFFVFRGHIPFG